MPDVAIFTVVTVRSYWFYKTETTQGLAELSVGS